MTQDDRRELRAGDHELIRRVAEEAARCAVREALVSLGVRAMDPISVQQDMATLHELREMFENEDFKKDLAHVRSWRLTMESINNKSVLTVITLFVTSILAILVVGLKQMFHVG